VRLLSNGENGRYYRVSVIDSRGEIGGSGTLDLGVNTDVLNMLDKAKGTEIALRSMFPDFIAFDEIGTTAELNSVRGCFNAGVKIITTAHCSTKTELFARDVVRQIIESGAVSTVAILSKTLGAPPQIIMVGELKNYVSC
jgi:stage III sporulation protein AA